MRDHKTAKKGVLVIEDPAHPEGLIFEGELFGFPISVDAILKGGADRERGFGEVCFNTSMTGYQEILTDPSYYGQIVCMTVPHVGNTGVNLEDPESKQPWCAGFVVHEFSEDPSNWRSTGTFEQYLIDNKIPALTGVDTRALTRYLRTKGAARGVILPKDEASQGIALLRKLPGFEGRDLIGEVSTKEKYSWPPAAAKHEKPRKEKPKYKVVALDYGVKWNLLRSLYDRGCDLEVVPANTDAKTILAMKPDGVFLSNGPGDPSAAPYAADTVKNLIGKMPIFGVCMGHQILSLALGGKTYKLKFGHRGGNQPVMSAWTGQVEISSQNHGYAVDPKSLPSEVEITHVNLNDKTCEGMRVKDKNVFSVQYHPEACPGPHDSSGLFDVFIEMMKKSRDT